MLVKLLDISVTARCVDIMRYLLLLGYMIHETVYHSRIFGRRAYPNIPLELRHSDHHDVAYEGILAGYNDDHLI